MKNFSVSKKADSQTAEIHEKLVTVFRCTKVVKGGRKFSFGAIVVVGDGKGRAGMGLGKASEIADARAKALQAAKKSMIRIPLRDGRTLHTDIRAKFCSGDVILRTAPTGTGVIAGGPLRMLFEVLGIKDVVSKSIGSTNPHNMLKAAFKGLQSIKSPKYIAEKRNKKVGEIVSRRNRKAFKTSLIEKEV